jgi:hypothetical protein
LAFAGESPATIEICRIISGDDVYDLGDDPEGDIS